MVEAKNISGNDEQVLFPWINDPAATDEAAGASDIGFVRTKAFNNGNIRRGNKENAYLTSLSISNTYTSSITVDLYIFNGREHDTTGVYTYTDYYILKSFSIAVGASIILDQEDLHLVDLKNYGLKMKLGTSSDTASVMFKVLGVQTGFINKNQRGQNNVSNGNSGGY